MGKITTSSIGSNSPAAGATTTRSASSSAASREPEVASVPGATRVAGVGSATAAADAAQDEEDHNGVPQTPTVGAQALMSPQNVMRREEHKTRRFGRTRSRDGGIHPPRSIETTGRGISVASNITTTSTTTSSELAANAAPPSPPSIPSNEPRSRAFRNSANSAGAMDSSNLSRSSSGEVNMSASNRAKRENLKARVGRTKSTDSIPVPPTIGENPVLINSKDLEESGQENNNTIQDGKPKSPGVTRGLRRTPEDWQAKRAALNASRAPRSPSTTNKTTTTTTTTTTNSEEGGRKDPNNNNETIITNNETTTTTTTTTTDALIVGYKSVVRDEETGNNIDDDEPEIEFETEHDTLLPAAAVERGEDLEDPITNDENDNTPTLIEATIVEEPSLVMAEPLLDSDNHHVTPFDDEGYNDEHHPSSGASAKFSFSRRWLCGAALIFILLILGVGIMAGVLVSRQSSSQDADSDTSGQVVSAPSPTTGIPPPTTTHINIFVRNNTTTDPTSVPSTSPTTINNITLTDERLPLPIINTTNQSAGTTMAPSSSFPHLTNQSSSPQPSTLQPTITASQEPSSTPTSPPTQQPTPQPSTLQPTITPSQRPSLTPTSPPTQEPSHQPTLPKPYGWLNIDYLPEFTLQAIADNTKNPQARASTWLKEHPDYSTMPAWRKRQLFALATLYYGTGGSYVEGHYSWTFEYDYWLNDTIHECQWEGDATFQQKCTPAGAYQYLDLGGDGLRGSLPPEISFLTSSESLIFRNNEIRGQLPTQLGLMTAMTHITFGGNELVGTIPSELGQLTRLTLLALRGNRLTSTIPSTLANLTASINFQLYGNRLSGTVPTWLGQFTALTTLTLNDNFLNGTIPSEVAQLVQLTNLRFDNNTLTGPLPEGTSALTDLVVLKLGNNQLNGPIPSDLAFLTNLKTLELFNNSFSGAIPVPVCGFSALETLKLDCDLVDCPCGDKCECM